MEIQMNKLKQEYTNLLLLSKDPTIKPGDGVHRAIMIEMGKIKLEILKLSNGFKGAYKIK